MGAALGFALATAMRPVGGRPDAGSIRPLGADDGSPSTQPPVASGESTSTAPSGGGSDDIPELAEPPRDTIAFLGADFADGVVRYTVRLKVIGWRGSRASRALIVRLIDAELASGKPRRELDIATADYVVILRSAADRKALEGRARTLELRPEGGIYQASLL